MADDTPSGTRPFGFYDTFAQMLNDLAATKGYHLHSQLARAIDPKATETLEKNVGNWRSGKNLPSPSYLKPLAKALDLTPEQTILWNRLYRKAQEQGKEKTDTDKIPVQPPEIAEPEAPTATQPTPLPESAMGEEQGGAKPPTPQSPETRGTKTHWTEAFKTRLKILVAIIAIVSATAGVIWTVLPYAQRAYPFFIELENKPVSPNPVKGFSQLNTSELVVIGTNNAPIKAYAIVVISDCLVNCVDFFKETMPYLYETYIDKGILSVVMIPWWDGSAKTDPDFELHYGISCLPKDRQLRVMTEMYQAGLASIENIGRTYGIIRTLGGSEKTTLNCLHDQARRDRLISETLNLNKYIPGYAARFYLDDGQLFDTKDTKNISLAILKRIQPKFTGP